ncbi:MAG: recombination-associated protein RdgC [Desulfovibrio sp.]|jgi:hypothetical protein|nr:recombination-associated protein RdgC [Desulfovibrio sp.]
MGFANNTCSFTRFRILDSAPETLWSEIPDRLRKFAFHDIDNIPEMQSCGWVNFEDMLDSTWNETPPDKATCFVFSLRLDRRRIPPGVVKKHLALALREEKERLRIQDKTFISRERKKEIREQVQLRLRRHFLPVPGEFNVLWLTERNEVWFASTRSNMIDMFLEEFLKTFELHLEQVTPYTLAASMLNEEGALCLDQLDATNFAPRSTV